MKRVILISMEENRVLTRAKKRAEKRAAKAAKKEAVNVIKTIWKFFTGRL